MKPQKDVDISTVLDAKRKKAEADNRQKKNQGTKPPVDVQWVKKWEDLYPGLKTRQLVSRMPEERADIMPPETTDTNKIPIPITGMESCRAEMRFGQID